MTKLAHRLGLSTQLAFHDVYSLDDSGLLSLVPRPAHALLVIIPMSETWMEFRKTEDVDKEEYNGCGYREPIVWFEQTIGNACGLIGFLHSVCNGAAADMITEGSDLDKLLKDAIPLRTTDRANLLYESENLEAAHQSAAVTGDTDAPDANDEIDLHFVAFVKGKDGHLWELEGGRKGPLDRGQLGPDDDALCEAALELGVKRYIKMSGGDLRFSCVALAPQPS